MAALRRMSLVTIMVLFVDIATAANDATFSESSILTVDDLKLLRDWGLVSGYSSSACCMSTKGCNDPATFHANCDNASRTVVVAELANGKRIGGYTGKASWELEGYCKTAPESFLFSLNNKYRHTLRNNEESSFCPYPTQGPRFGFKHEFFVDDGFDRMNCHNLGDVYKCRNGTVTSACEDDFCGGQFKVGSSYWVSISKLEVFVLQATCEAFKCPAGFARTHTAAASPSTAVCCQPECAVPSSTQGYDFEYAGGVLTISGFAPQNVYCAKGYAGDVTYTPCSSAGTPYTVSGCLPVCTVPSSPGYNFSSTGGVRTISGFNPTGVTCADGYTGTVSYEVCSSAGTPSIRWHSLYGFGLCC
eukprot:TRINITY_DN3774_c0_g2_i7.p1 TRINITY_DN3774_c0_g2~~TRINITY_DN3774_c0_g2_i7.p1  ORF type:complete len:360 (+),score=27.66 TRINITY_DN3774_c0_g2_i7:66-1145(+)